MTEEQLKQKAESEADKVIVGSGMDRASVIHLKHLLATLYIQGYHARAIENGIQWHKITDWKNQEQFPQEETFPFFVRTKKDGDYLCEWNITEGYGQFYSMYEGEDIDPEDVVLWAKIEIPQFKE